MGPLIDRTFLTLSNHPHIHQIRVLLSIFHKNLPFSGVMGVMSASAASNGFGFRFLFSAEGHSQFYGETWEIDLIPRPMILVI